MAAQVLQLFSLENKVSVTNSFIAGISLSFLKKSMKNLSFFVSRRIQSHSLLTFFFRNYTSLAIRKEKNNLISLNH